MTNNLEVVCTMEVYPSTQFCNSPPKYIYRPMRLLSRFTLIFAAKIPHHSIDNNVKIFRQTQTHNVNEP